MALRALEPEEEEGEESFRSIAPAWAPAGAGTRAFGGHVLAQAAWAASRTVATGMVVHVWLLFFFSPPRSSAHLFGKVLTERESFALASDSDSGGLTDRI